MCLRLGKPPDFTDQQNTERRIGECHPTIPKEPRHLCITPSSSQCSCTATWLCVGVTRGEGRAHVQTVTPGIVPSHFHRTHTERCCHGAGHPQAGSALTHPGMCCTGSVSRLVLFSKTSRTAGGWVLVTQPCNTTCLLFRWNDPHNPHKYLPNASRLTSIRGPPSTDPACAAHPSPHLGLTLGSCLPLAALCRTSFLPVRLANFPQVRISWVPPHEGTMVPPPHLFSTRFHVHTCHPFTMLFQCYLPQALTSGNWRAGWPPSSADFQCSAHAWCLSPVGACQHCGPGPLGLRARRALFL